MRETNPMPQSIVGRVARIAAPVALLAALALPAATTNAQPPAAPTGQECFLTRNINGFNAPDDKTLYIRVGVNDYWRVDLMIPCTGLTFRQRIGIEAIPSANSWICQPIQAQVVYRDTGIAQRCPVSGLHKLTPAEYAALPKRDRP